MMLLGGSRGACTWRSRLSRLGRRARSNFPVGWQPLQSLEQMGPLAVFALAQIIALAEGFAGHE